MTIGKNIQLLSVLLLLTALFSCKKDDHDNPEKVWPTTYNGANYDANTLNERNLITGFNQVIAAIGTAATNQKPLRFDSLLALYQTGANSPFAANTSYFNDQIAGTNGILQRADWGSRQLLFPRFPSDSGAVYGKYIFDGKGLDLGEMVEKTSFGSVFFRKIIELTRGDISKDEVDKMVALFGAHPDFPNTPTASKTSHPDNFIAKYAARRDKNDGLGLYSEIKKSFVTLQEAVKFGHTYHSEMEKSVSVLKLSIEKVFAASVINYCGSVQGQLSATTFGNAQKAAALHSLGEGIGFLFGLKAVPPADRKITDAQIDEILGLFYFHAEGNSTCYFFIDNPLATIDRLAIAKTRLQSIYGFSDQEMADFSKNWVNEQGR